MKHSLAFSFVALLGTAQLVEAQTNLMWNQASDGYSAVPSTVQTAPAVNLEAADDFDTTGLIERVIVEGYACFGCGGGLAVDGVWIRFYAWDAGSPGALQHEVFLEDDDPLFLWNASYPDVLDVTLPEPFLASGKHFVSAQLVTPGENGWGWWTSGDARPAGSTLRYRDNLAGGSWGGYAPIGSELERDLAFQLWGQGPAAPPPPRLLYSQQATFTDLVTVASGLWPGNQLEAADDFELDARITKVVFSGYVQYNSPYPSAIGAWMRFYEGSSTTPGALLYETFAAADSPVFAYGPTVLHFELPLPLEVHGKVFVSVQLAATNANGWGWRRANALAHDPAVVRDGAGAWQTLQLGGQTADLAMLVYGSDLTPPPTLHPDPCGDWQAMGMPLPAGAQRSIARDLKVFAANDVWAVGDKLVELGYLDVATYSAAWHFDGTAWSEIPTPSPEPFPGAGSVYLWAVDGVAANDVWAGGTALRQNTDGFLGSQTLALHRDGAGWSVVDTPLTPAGASGAGINGIEALASDDVWFVGGYTRPSGCDRALAMHWDGSEFEIFETPCSGIPGGTPGFELEAVAAVSSDDVWAVGGGSDGDYSATTYIVHWDGSSWTYVPAPAPGLDRRLYDVEAIASDDVWAVGSFFELSGYEAFALHWDGAGWTLFEGPAFPVGAGALHAFAADDVYAVGGGVSHWDGTSWRWVEDFGQQQGQHIGVSNAALDAVSPCELWTAGRQVVAGQLVPFSARQVSNRYWATLPESGCHASAPAESLVPVTTPVLGTTFRAALGDPLGETGLAGGTAYWAFSFAPSADPECGLALPRLGKDGGPGHLLIHANPFAVVGPGSWTGGGASAVLAVDLPANPALIGFRAYTQGLLFGPGRRVLTEALEIQLGL